MIFAKKEPNLRQLGAFEFIDENGADPAFDFGSPQKRSESSKIVDRDCRRSEHSDGLLLARTSLLANRHELCFGFFGAGRGGDLGPRR